MSDDALLCNDAGLTYVRLSTIFTSSYSRKKVGLFVVSQITLACIISRYRDAAVLLGMGF
jgi:hypothetical protein